MKWPWVGAFTDFGGPDTEIPFTFWGFWPKITQNQDFRGWCSISGGGAGFRGELWVDSVKSDKRVALSRRVEGDTVGWTLRMTELGNPKR